MATSVLSLGLLIPFGAGSATDRIVKTVTAVVAPGPIKHVTLTHDGLTESLATHASTAEDLLAERGLIRAAEDALNVDPAAPLVDGEAVVYRGAVPVTVVIDGQPHAVRTPAATVADVLGSEHIVWDRHDRVTPEPAAAVENESVISVRHVEAWTETVRKPVPAATVKRFAFTLPPGKSVVVDPGAAGMREIAYRVTRTADRAGLRRALLVSRILRAPKARIVAEGVGEYTALSALAQRGIAGTLRLASSALSMVATAYTANCAGCSGITASGRAAGHGIVAVDPRVIPLGTRMYIPGYGHAVAGDTGGAIRGRRIDLGFNSDAAANRFGRRPVTVYLIK